MPLPPRRDPQFQLEIDQDLESMKKEELLRRAAELGIEGRSQMLKDELVDAIEEAEGRE